MGNGDEGPKNSRKFLQSSSTIGNQKHAIQCALPNVRLRRPPHLAACHSNAARSSLCSSCDTHRKSGASCCRAQGSTWRVCACAWGCRDVSWCRLGAVHGGLHLSARRQNAHCQQPCCCPATATTCLLWGGADADGVVHEGQGALDEGQVELLAADECCALWRFCHFHHALEALVATFTCCWGLLRVTREELLQQALSHPAHTCTHGAHRYTALAVCLQHGTVACAVGGSILAACARHNQSLCMTHSHVVEVGGRCPWVQLRA